LAHYNRPRPLSTEQNKIFFQLCFFWSTLQAKERKQARRGREEGKEGRKEGREAGGVYQRICKEAECNSRLLLPFIIIVPILKQYIGSK
jgi:hypothetical protein